MADVSHDMECLVAQTVALGWGGPKDPSDDGWEDPKRATSLVLLGKLITT